LNLAKKHLSVVYVSPGWPLSNFPNGIVTYIQNLLPSLSDDICADVLAHQVGNDIFDESVVDLSKIVLDENIVTRLISKILYRIKTQYVEQQLCQHRWVKLSKQIVAGIESLEKQPNLIEIEETFGLTKGLVAATDIPIITRLHGPWFTHGPNVNISTQTDYYPRVKAEGLGIKASHGVSAPSHDVLERVREYYNIALPDAAVIPNPVLPVHQDLQWAYRSEVRPTVLFVGRFEGQKGGDLAVDSFRIMAQYNKEIELLFVGPDSGIFIDHQKFSFQQYVDKFIAETHIKNRIHFLGHCSSEHIASLRRSSTVTIMTSRYETFSISLAEALATGSPVVASNVGAIKELVTDGFNGVLAEPESAESIAEKVIALICDSDHMQMLSDNAIVDSRERFSPEVVAKQTIKFYRSVLNGC